MKYEYVQYGCGWCAPDGWLNFDGSPTLRFERIPILGSLYTKNEKRFPENVLFGDIVRGLPIPPMSCAGIYCSHVLEHLALSDFHKALDNTYRYLKEGGVFRLVVPDLEQLVQRYLNESHPMAASHFMEATGLGKRERGRGIMALLSEWFGGSAHLWMWDEKSMKAQLMEHGFKEVRRAEFGDAEDIRFSEVEDRIRFTGCLAMQAKK